MSKYMQKNIFFVGPKKEIFRIYLFNHFVITYVYVSDCLIHNALCHICSLTKATS